MLAQSIAEMAIDGREGNEGTCFWFGNRTDGDAEISHLILLRGRGISKSPLNVSVSAELMREVHERTEALGLTLVAQIHSHSSFCGVDMSASDHAYGVSVPYFLSIICPDYAQNPETTFRDCGVHLCLPTRGYVRLTQKEVKRKMILVPGLVAATSLIGEDYEN